MDAKGKGQVNPRNDQTALDAQTDCGHDEARLAISLPSLGVQHSLCAACRLELERRMVAAVPHREVWEKSFRLQDEKSVDGRNIYDDMFVVPQSRVILDRKIDK